MGWLRGRGRYGAKMSADRTALRDSIGLFRVKYVTELLLRVIGI